MRIDVEAASELMRAAGYTEPWDRFQVSFVSSKPQLPNAVYYQFFTADEVLRGVSVDATGGKVFPK